MKQSYYLFIILFSFCLIACDNNKSSGSAGKGIQDKIVSKALSGEKTFTESGESIDRYPNGVIKMKGMMIKGQRGGLWKSWYENGSPWSETTFTEGKKNGKTTTWYKNEQKRYEGYYKDDKECGKWTFWDEKGNIINQKTYDK